MSKDTRNEKVDQWFFVPYDAWPVDVRTAQTLTRATPAVAAISVSFFAVDDEGFGLFEFATTTPIRGKSTF
jgi:hypothetical protein